MGFSSDVITRILTNENTAVFLCGPDFSIRDIGLGMQEEAALLQPGQKLCEIFPEHESELADALHRLGIGFSFHSTNFEFIHSIATLFFVPVMEDDRLISVLCFPSAAGADPLLPEIGNRFRAPAAGLLTTLSSLAARLQKQDEYGALDYLNEAAGYCYQMLRSASMLRDYSLLSSHSMPCRPKALLLNRFLDELCRTLRHHMSNIPLRLEFESDDAPLLVDADADLLARAFFHLITNACVFSPREATITVRLTSGPGRAEISISDEGDGIEPADIPKAFTPFFIRRAPVAEEAMGIGLGLPIAREIALLHGGNLILTSRPNRGVTVALSLPLASPAPGDLSLHSEERPYGSFGNDKFSDLTVLFFSICKMKLY